MSQWLLGMLVSGREAAGVWEGEWHFLLTNGILEGSSLPFAPVENVCGASLKTHWTAEWERFFAGVLCERVAISSWGSAVTFAALGCHAN